MIQLVTGIQELLDNANVGDPAQIEAYQMYK
jgi:ubiquitin-conjugating enzyme E2 I